MSTEPAAAHAPVQTYEKEPVLDELERLYRKTGFAGSADPRQALFGYADPQDLKLEDGVSLYGHLTQMRATLKLDGQTLKQALHDLFDSDDYNDAVDADAGQSITSQGDRSRGYMVSRVFGRYNAAIKAEVAASSPIAKRYLVAAAAKHRDDAYLSAVSLDALANNPALYRAHGIDPDTYGDKLTEGASDDGLAPLRPEPLPEHEPQPEPEPEAEAQTDEPEEQPEEPDDKGPAEELEAAVDSGSGQ